LPTDMYPKIPAILKGIKPYEKFTAPLLQNKIQKTKKVFDDKKITDHHAIIPTGQNPIGLNLKLKQVYDVITRRFIAAFYPECIISNTTVLGEVEKIKFKATGKQILEEGWRILYPKKKTDTKKEDKKSQIMPVFTQGESGEHKPDLQEKQTLPPKQYTEATLLRAMETAGKQIDDDEIGEIMKENGIGRPSTRANIIETLFRRRYITKEKKNILPTQTGIQLIKTIENELLKSVELTGRWEKKLREIEKGEYEASVFIEEMKKMVTDLVCDVKQGKGKYISIAEETSPLTCPKCGKGTMIKGKSAYGCSRFREGCNFIISFEKLKTEYKTDVLTAEILKKESHNNTN
ncbi:MAG: DNA topoisomerase, partial [Bacteroidota bacterium]|nr:DNA topoisomerase [Bacteroidota bacterium]